MHLFYINPKLNKKTKNKKKGMRTNKKSIFESTNYFYFYKIIHEFSKANIPDACVNK